MARNDHCEGPDGMQPCFRSDGQLAVTDCGRCAGCDRFVKDLAPKIPEGIADELAKLATFTAAVKKWRGM